MRLAEKKIELVVDAFKSGTPKTVEAVKELLMLKNTPQAEKYIEAARKRMKDPLFDIDEPTATVEVTDAPESPQSATTTTDFDPFANNEPPQLDTYEFYVMGEDGVLSELNFKVQRGSRLILEYPKPKEVPVHELPDDALHPTLNIPMGELRRAVGIEE